MHFLLCFLYSNICTWTEKKPLFLKQNIKNIKHGETLEALLYLKSKNVNRNQIFRHTSIF